MDLYAQSGYVYNCTPGAYLEIFYFFLRVGIEALSKKVVELLLMTDPVRDLKHL